jgi:hypothetical protein
VKGVEPIWSKHARDKYADLRDLFRAGEAAASLGFDQGWQSVLALVRAEVDEIEAKLGGSNPLSHIEYAHLHGQVRGLKAIQEARTALVQRYVTQREEQERKHEAARESTAGR